MERYTAPTLGGQHLVLLSKTIHIQPIIYLLYCYHLMVVIKSHTTCCRKSFYPQAVRLINSQPTVRDERKILLY